jgi:hypothetical protein
MKCILQSPDACPIAWYNNSKYEVADDNQLFLRRFEYNPNEVYDAFSLGKRGLNEWFQVVGFSKSIADVWLIFLPEETKI